MKQWLSSLNTRERQMLMSGVGLLVIILLYLMVWEPLSEQREELKTSVRAQQNTYAWMQQAESEIKKLAGRSRQEKNHEGSMLGTISNSAKLILKGAVLKRVEEDRQQGVRVWIEQVAFDDLVRWLGQIQQQYGIRVSSLVSEKHNKSGRVNVRLILQR